MVQTEKTAQANSLIIIILQSPTASFRITFRSLIRSFSVTVIFGHFRFRGAQISPIVLYKYIFIYTIDPNDRIIFENDRKWPWPKMTAFQRSKNDSKGSFCNQMQKPKTLIHLHISYLRTIFQHSTGKSLLSAPDFCIFAPAIERTVFLCQESVIYDDRGWS